MVTVTLKNGERWSGVFHGSRSIAHLAPSAAQDHVKESNAKYSIVLRMASKVVGDEEKGNTEAPKAMLVVDEGEFVALKYSLPKRATRGFQTDTEISAASVVNTERQLATFQHDAEAAHTLNFSLAERSHDQGSWNQFEANAGMLNTAATPYREDLYTTSLDRSSAAYRTKIAEATRLAAEIEGGVTHDIHIAEERGQIVQDDGGMDEEDRYSMVLNTAKAKGSYVVPALRDRSQQQHTHTGQANGGMPPGIAVEKNAKRTDNPANANAAPQTSSSPKQGRASMERLSGLNLASGAEPKKAFQPYSLDPSKNGAASAANPATRTEDTARLRKTSTDIDEKVKLQRKDGSPSDATLASGTADHGSTNVSATEGGSHTAGASTGGAAPTSASPGTPATGSSTSATTSAKKDMRSFMNASAWVAPGQRKGQEIFDSLGSRGGASTSPSSHTPPASVVPVSATSGPMAVPMSGGAPPQQFAHFGVPVQHPVQSQHPSAVQQQHPQQQMQIPQQVQPHMQMHPMMAPQNFHMQQVPVMGVAPQSMMVQGGAAVSANGIPMEAPPSAGFKSLLRADVSPHSVADVYRYAFGPHSLEQKVDWERKMFAPPYAMPNPAASTFGFAPSPSGAPMMMTAAFAPQMQFAHMPHQQ